MSARIKGLMTLGKWLVLHGVPMAVKATPHMMMDQVNRPETAASSSSSSEALTLVLIGCSLFLLFHARRRSLPNVRTRSARG